MVLIRLEALKRRRASLITKLGLDGREGKWCADCGAGKSYECPRTDAIKSEKKREREKDMTRSKEQGFQV